jgi:hypothetical protein
VSDAWSAFARGLAPYEQPHNSTTVPRELRFARGARTFFLSVPPRPADPWGWLRTQYAAHGASAVANSAAAMRGGYRGAPDLAMIVERPLGLALRPAQVSTFISSGDLASDRRVGVDAFDQAVFVQSGPSEHVVRQVLLAEQSQRAVLALFSLGCALLVIDDVNGDVKARIEGERMPVREDLAEAVIDTLDTLVESLPRLSTARR